MHREAIPSQELQAGREARRMVSKNGTPEEAPQEVRQVEKKAHAPLEKRLGNSRKSPNASRRKEP